MKAYFSIRMSEESWSICRADVIFFWFMQPTPNTWDKWLSCCCCCCCCCCVCGGGEEKGEENVHTCIACYMCCCQTSLALLCIFHSILSRFFISQNFDAYCCHLILIPYTKSHIVLHLYWLIKLTKTGLLEETGSRRNQGGVLERATPCGFGCHMCSCILEIYVCTCYYMSHGTWVQWIVSPCYQDLLTHHLFDMQLPCGMGHKIAA